MPLFLSRRTSLVGLADEHAHKIEDLLAKLDKRPGDLRVRRQVGDAYLAAGKTDAAVQHYHALVGAYAAQGLLFRAISACKLVLAVRPDDADATRMLSELYARRTSGRESSELTPALSAALVPDDDAYDAIKDDALPVSLSDAEAIVELPPPLPGDAGDDDDILDVTALAAALTPLPEGAVRLERPPAVPLFSGLSSASFRQLVKKLSAWEAEEGAVIVGEGEESDTVFVVVRGRVRVERGGVTLATLGPNAFFGEMALLSKKPRVATVIAEVKTELLEISREVLEDLVKDDPSVAVALDGFNKSRLLDNLARTSPILKELPLDVVKDALAKFDSTRAKAGDTVVTEGDKGRGLYVVLAGVLDVVAAGELGTVRVKQLEAGDVFGEMSLLTGAPASASVVAASDCALLFLDKDAFRELAAANPALSERLVALAAQRAEWNAQFLVPDETSSAVLV